MKGKPKRPTHRIAKLLSMKNPRILTQITTRKKLNQLIFQTIAPLVKTMSEQAAKV